VAVDVTSASGPGGGPAGAAYRPGAPAAEALIRIATGIEREWIDATSRSIEHELDEASGVVRAWRVDRYDAIVLGRHSAQVDLDVAARLVADGYRRRGPSEADSQLLARLAFAGAPATFDDLVAAASAGLRRLDDVDLAHHLDPESRRALQRHAPAELKLPSGRTVRLEYRDDGRVVAATKLQHVFGLTQTPRLGPKQTPVTFELLAPNGRPVQVTADLASFWARVYPEIRGPLQARYPKHEWK
jgi:ATP-dependent helicase HrpB